MTTMDPNDLGKEMDSIRLPSRSQPGRRLDMTVKNANLKVVVLRAVAFLFLASLFLLVLYALLNVNRTTMDTRVLYAALLVLVVAGALVSLKLWSLDFSGWTWMFMICLCGILLPLMAAYSHGIMIGTILIIAASLIWLAMLWYAKDVLGVKKFSDIFNMR